MKETRFKCEACESRTTDTSFSSGWFSVMDSQYAYQLVKGIEDHKEAKHFCGSTHALQFLSKKLGSSHTTESTSDNEI